MEPDDAKCPLCRTALQDPQPPRTGEASEYSCQRCGRFALGGSAKMELPTYAAAKQNLGFILSHAVRGMQRADARPLVDHGFLERTVRDGRIPSPGEQAENLLLWLGENLTTPGEPTRINDSTHGAIIGSAGDQNFYWIARHLIEAGLLEGGQDTGGSRVTLSFNGWHAVQELKRGSSSRRIAFMAMPYGSATLDEVVASAFRPAVEAAGYVLERLDDEPKAGLIDNRLRVKIRTCRFLVADLTDGNQGAYWEAGFAEGLGKPVIYTCEKNVFKEKKTHFDTNHHLTVTWETEHLEDAKERLKAAIRATLPDEAKLTDE